MIKEIQIHMEHLMTDQVQIQADELLELFVHTELLPYTNGIYKDGPTIFEMTPTQFTCHFRNKLNEPTKIPS